MLKKEITYVNFNEEEVTRTEYFNYTKTELRALEHSIEGGFSTRLQNIAAEKNIGKIYEQMAQLVLKAYGARSEDGERFLKNDSMTEDFRQSAAFDALMEELISSPDGGADFILQCLPASVRADALQNAAVREQMGEQQGEQQEAEIQYQMPIDQGGPQDAAPTQNPHVDTTPPVQIQTTTPAPTQDVHQSTLERELRQGEF